MMHPPDPVDDRVAHVNIRRGHVDPGAENHFAVFEFAGAHPAEEIEVLFDRTVPAGGFPARNVEVAAVFVPLLGREVADVGFVEGDEFFGAFVHPVEIIARIIEPVAEIEPQPPDILRDRRNVFGILFRRIGVIHAQIAVPAVFCGDAEIQADRLGVTDVQISVRLRREAGYDLAAELVVAEIFGDHLPDEVARNMIVFNAVGHDMKIPVLTNRNLILRLPDNIPRERIFFQ